MGIIRKLFSRMYRRTLVHRYDDDGIIKYFSASDFKGLESAPFDFRTPEGNLVKGCQYSYPNPDKSELVVFCHGIGGGHRSYMREIEVLCAHGYQVAAYDNVGCFESEGSDIRGMTESINDLVAFMDYAETREDWRDRGLVLIGHSWGGYAVGNVMNYRTRNIKAVVVISGLAGIDPFYRYSSNGRYRAIVRLFKDFERGVNPRFVDSCSVDAFEKTSVPVLLIHSVDDPVVDIRSGIDYVRSRVTNPKVRYLEVSGKFHNPNYTEDAVNYMNSTFGEYGRLLKEKRLVSFEDRQNYMSGKDFHRMTEQDSGVWEKILHFIGGCGA